MSNEMLMSAARQAVQERLAAAEESLRDARMLVRRRDDDVRQQLANVLDDVAFILYEIDEQAAADGAASAGHELTLRAQSGMTANVGQIDPNAAEELLLYLQNDSRFWGPRSQGDALERRYAKLWKRGQFNATRAADGYMHVLKTAAQQYAKEHGSPGQRWYEMFNVPTRRAAADELVEQFVAEAELGNFRG